MPLHSQHLELDLGAVLPTPSAGKAVLGMDADGALVTKTPAGLASPVAFPKLAAHPSTPTDKAIGYCLDVLGTDQFFVKTEDGTTHQITPPSAGGGGALPFVIVAASQSAPAGYAYLVVAQGVVLTLAAGVAADRFSVLDVVADGTLQVIADTVAPDQINDDSGNAAASVTLPAGAPSNRTYQFAGALGAVWVQTSREPYGTDEGTLPHVGTYAAIVPGFAFLTGANAVETLPDPALTADSARLAIIKLGTLTTIAVGGAGLIENLDGTQPTTQDVTGLRDGTRLDYQLQAGSGLWRLVSWSSDGDPYVAGAPGDWDTAPPTTRKDALDRIAAAVAGLLGTPIL